MSNMAGKVLSIYLSNDLKAQWLRFCAENETTSSEAMRDVIRKLTSRLSVSPVFQTIHEQPDLRRRRLEIRLTESEFRSVHELAKASGSSPNTWVVNLIRANLTRTPQLGFCELQMLGKSNSNCWRSGEI
jgi:hypothetical protein